MACHGHALGSIGGIVHVDGIVNVEPIGAVVFAKLQRVLDVNLTSFPETCWPASNRLCRGQVEMDPGAS